VAVVHLASVAPLMRYFWFCDSPSKDMLSSWPPSPVGGSACQCSLSGCRHASPGAARNSRSIPAPFPRTSRAAAHHSRSIQPTSLRLQLEHRLGLPTSWVGVSLFSAANATQLMWCIFGACGFPNILHGTSLPSWYYFSCGSTSIEVHQILIGYSLSRKGRGKSESEGR